MPDALAPVPVLLVLSPDVVRCSIRFDTAVLLAKLHLSAESARFWKRILVTLVKHKRFHTPGMGTRGGCAVQQVGTGAITGARNHGSSRKRNQWKHPAPNSEWQQKYDRQRQVAKITKKKRKKIRNPTLKPKERAQDTWRHDNSSLKRRMSHVGETVVIRILWGRRRASDTQSRQNKGQENATDRITGAPARGVEGRRTGKKMGGMAPIECPLEPAIFHYESVPSHGDPRSSSISGSLKSHDCLNWSGER
ncbi:hypothetical protein JB92DRAFT_2837243 [Gautieria morchelliformis]|nr:hypothetical protein JB92DRAFT_2837243 [Gautieria morchelliformis]